jgi:hypothetical protein
MAQRSDIDLIRKNYKKSVYNKDICKEMIQKFENNDSNGIDLAYLGAFQSIWAKHSVNPLQKLRTFNKGKNNIDKAIKQEPDQLESRLIRYSVQKESPRFLGYKKNIDEDRIFIQTNLNGVKEAVLKEMIIQILKE